MFLIIYLIGILSSYVYLVSNSPNSVDKFNSTLYLCASIIWPIFGIIHLFHNRELLSEAIVNLMDVYDEQDIVVDEFDNIIVNYDELDQFE
jgi:hypothetical protein